MKIPKEEWVKGEIYYIKDNGNEYIFKFLTETKDNYSISVIDEGFSPGCDFWKYVDDDEICRIATEEEKEWFRVCEEIGEYIDRDEFLKMYNPIYEIY